MDGSVGGNDALRFGLEAAALIAPGCGGWVAAAGRVRYLLAVGLPLLAGGAWGVFRVTGDPGPAPVAVPGPVRLLLGWALFCLVASLPAIAGRPRPAAARSLLLVGHSLLARDRVIRLLGGR